MGRPPGPCADDSNDNRLKAAKAPIAIHVFTIIGLLPGNRGQCGSPSIWVNGVFRNLLDDEVRF